MRRLLVVVIAGALAGACSRKSAPAPLQPDAEPIDPPKSAALAVKEPDPPRRPRKPPSGAPLRLSCDSARALITDVLARLAAPPAAVGKTAEAELHRNLAEGTLDWADPHGLWTASPDSPLASVVRARAPKIRAVLEGRADCRAELQPIGEALVKWVGELRADFRAVAKSGSAAVSGATSDAAFPAAFEAAFEDGALTKPARALTRELAARMIAVERHRPELAGELSVGRDRWLPTLDAEAWGEVVLAAAVRAYVPLIDPHGAWAPLDESATLYDRDLEVAPPPRLWTASTRTAIGVRVDAGAVAPLAERDVILSIDGVTIAGLSAEAIDQLGETTDELETRAVRVLRASKGDPQRLDLVKLDVRVSLGDSPLPPEPLATELVPYGEGRALIVHVPDVPDALGDDLARTIALAKDAPGFAGILLDLRGNGGGSIDGATSALGLFLPGAPLFPLKHRNDTIETERAAEPPVEDRWTGPVAAFVDGGTASAAEMIAGALHAYRRGAVVGAATYGKGCAQEYVDDVTGVGVLRLTTLLFALPDGSAVQRVGLRPDLFLSLPPPPGVKDREADLLRAAPTWIGPDVRDPKRIGDVPWPPAKAIGPCQQEAICRALRALSARHGDVAKR
ncbi:MAG: hypothetical protein HYV09_26450 [Deltaproteobacteria bacterium]|nr:hypothetical protein [Deltaproteobacteria bacterium]